LADWCERGCGRNRAARRCSLRWQATSFRGCSQHFAHRHEVVRCTSRTPRMSFIASLAALASVSPHASGSGSLGSVACLTATKKQV
jgi:hypothetical protein